jgi:putative alpha-1,2-mannosidase
LALGSQEYVITSPLFKNVQIKRDNGNHLNIVAINNNKNNKYIQSVKVDGNQYNDAYISSLNLLNNNHTIDFTMADNPTS